MTEPKTQTTPDSISRAVRNIETAILKADSEIKLHQGEDHCLRRLFNEAMIGVRILETKARLLCQTNQ
jgi:hypothetical protein